MDLSSLQSVASVLENCDSLKEIKLPTNTGSVTNMNSLFKGCSSMEIIYIPDFITPTVTDIFRWNFSEQKFSEK